MLIKIAPHGPSSVFLNRRAAARYRTLASIVPGREKPEETKICYMISLVKRLVTNLHVILCLSNMPHRVHKCTNTLYDYAIIHY